MFSGLKSLSRSIVSFSPRVPSDDHFAGRVTDPEVHRQELLERRKLLLRHVDFVGQGVNALPDVGAGGRQIDRGPSRRGLNASCRSR
jgi:hypothetical protein